MLLYHLIVYDLRYYSVIFNFKTFKSMIDTIKHNFLEYLKYLEIKCQKCMSLIKLYLNLHT